MKVVRIGDLEGLVRSMHSYIQVVLGQDTGETEADDGMEVGVCYIRQHLDELAFCGARFPLFLYRDDAVEEVRGARKRIGYHDVPADTPYPCTVLQVAADTTFYLTSDGLLD